MNKKSAEAKIKHHYVWGNYLKQWSSNNMDVFYTTKNGKIRCDSVKGIARENNFYKVKWLTDKHIEIIRAFSRLSPEHLQKYHNLCLDRFLGFQNAELDDLEARKIFECNGLEDLHTFNENEVKLLLHALAKRDFDVLDIENNMIKFCIYLGHQFARTKSFKENTLNYCATLIGREHPQIGEAIEECSWFLSYVVGMNFGVDLFNTRINDNHCVLLNDTELPFVTSDQPIINVFGELDRVDVSPPQESEFELYYPISPTVAYMIAKTGRFEQGNKSVSIGIVEELNTKISRKSDTFIVSSNSESLKALVKNRGIHAERFKQQFEHESS